MKKHWLYLVFALALVISARGANAFTFASDPLPVAIIKSSGIVDARVVRPPLLRVRTTAAYGEIEVIRCLKGSFLTGKLPMQMFMWHPLGTLTTGQRYIFFLRLGKATEDVPEVMFDGSRLWTEKYEQELVSAIALTPAWSQPQDGVSSIISASKFRIKAGEDLDLYVGYKNMSQQPIKMRYSDWPIETHTYCTLTVKPEDGAPIPASPHPTLTQQDINDYFSRSPNNREFILEPQQEVYRTLYRVNTAAQGWGYKEDLGFKYYPMAKPGKYQISAQAHNYSAHPLPAAAGLTVWVE